jgi:hypothetical protein
VTRQEGDSGPPFAPRDALRRSPESSETIRQTHPRDRMRRYGPTCMATCRGRQKCPAHSVPLRKAQETQVSWREAWGLPPSSSPL